MLRQLIKKGILILVLAMLPMSIFAGEVALNGAEVGKWTMDYDAALKVAKEKKLPLFLNFTGSDWCVWCKLMDQSVFSKDAWQQYAKDKLVLVTIDFPRNKSALPAEYVQRNYHLQNQFGVQGYPTFLILDEDGETLLGQLGAGRDKTAESFIAEVKNTIQFRDTEFERKAAKLNGEQLAQFQSAVSEYKATQTELESWLDTQPAKNDENMEKFHTFLAKLKQAKEKIVQF